jgi:hypothetical protein
MNEVYEQMGEQDAEECQEFGNSGGGKSGFFGGFFGSSSKRKSAAMPIKKKKANDTLSSNLYNM